MILIIIPPLANACVYRLKNLSELSLFLPKAFNLIFFYSPWNSLVSIFIEHANILKNLSDLTSSYNIP